MFLDSGVSDLPVCPLYSLPHSKGMLYVPRELRFRSLAGRSRRTERHANRTTGITKLIRLFFLCALKRLITTKYSTPVEVFHTMLSSASI